MFPNYLMNHLNDVASAIWNIAFFLSEIIGMILGSFLV